MRLLLGVQSGGVSGGCGAAAAADDAVVVAVAVAAAAVAGEGGGADPVVGEGGNLGLMVVLQELNLPCDSKSLYHISHTSTILLLEIGITT